MSSTRAQLYFRLAVLLESGISIIEAFKMVSSDASRESRSFKEVLVGLENGHTLKSAVEATKTFSFLEISLNSVGEESGTLPDTWRYLSKYYEERSKFMQQWISRLYYPAFLIHSAIFLSHVTIVISAGIGAYFLAVLQSLLTLYIIIFGPVIALWQLYKIDHIKIAMDTIFLKIPFINTLILYFQLSYAFSIVHGMYHCGINISSAIGRAKEAISFSPLKNTFARIEDKIMDGESLEDAMKQETIFPDFIYKSIVVGEMSGRLDTTLQKVCQLTDEKCYQLLSIFLRVTTGFIIGIVMLWVVLQILGGFGSYFDSINSFIP